MTSIKFSLWHQSVMVQKKLKLDKWKPSYAREQQIILSPLECQVVQKQHHGFIATADITHVKPIMSTLWVFFT